MSKKRTFKIGKAPTPRPRSGPEYPFSSCSEHADLPMVEQLLLSPEVSEEAKQCIQESMVIDATNVSDYYYEGTDQEVWDRKKDFPNVAPPFELFLLTFDAPSQIVSNVRGITDVPEVLAGWCVLCEGVDISQALPPEDTDESRAMIREMAELTARSARETLLAYSEKYQHDGTHGMIEPIDELKTALANLQAGSHVLELIDEERWSDARQFIARTIPSDARWSLSMHVFFKFFIDGRFQCVGPVWSTQLMVMTDGKIGFDADNKIRELNFPQGQFARDIQTKSQLTGRSIIDIGYEYNGFVNVTAINSALLAISFMHCKNVAINKMPSRTVSTPARAHVSQKPAGEIDFYTLDITPMKRVLRTEGQSDRVGSRKALHICRGHFAHYENGRGLFGRHKGTYWIPQHLRGNSQVGTIFKDYRVSGL